jgi:hypothetical protein
VTDGRAWLIQADSAGGEVRLPLADATVDMVMCSPPYLGQRDYGAGPREIGSEPTPREFLEALWSATREMVRVLKPSGSIFVNLGDSYARPGGGADVSARTLARTGAGATQRRPSPAQPGVREKSQLELPAMYAAGCTGMLAHLGGPDPGLRLIQRARITLHKRNGLPESATDRVRTNDQEVLYHFVVEPTYYSAVDELREPYSPEASQRRALYGQNPGRDGLAGLRATGVAQHGSSGVTAMGIGGQSENPLGKLPGSVWSLTNEPLITPDYMLPDSSEDMAPQWAMKDRDAWRLLAAGLIPNASGLPRDDGRGELRAAPSHYAAFPSELPRRCILGWSPPGICVVCNQGRWPVVDMQRQPTARQGTVSPAWRGPMIPGRETRTDVHALGTTPQATILGYACSCTPFTDHPGTGETTVGHHDVGRMEGWPNTGAGWGGKQGLGDRPKVGPWREYHLNGWRAPPTRSAVVLDPFAGTFTTVMVAKALDRIGIGLELSRDYCRLGGWRLGATRLAGKAISRTNRERQGGMVQVPAQPVAAKPPLAPKPRPVKFEQPELF